MANENHIIEFSLEEYQEAARIWRQPLLLLPLFAAKESLKFMTGIPGVRYSVAVGTAESNAQFAPYKASRMSAGTTDVIYRDLKTYFGNVVKELCPDFSIIMRIQGQWYDYVFVFDLFPNLLVNYFQNNFIICDWVSPVEKKVHRITIKVFIRINTYIFSI